MRSVDLKVGELEDGEKLVIKYDLFDALRYEFWNYHSVNLKRRKKNLFYHW